MATVIEKEEAEAIILFRERIADLIPKLSAYKQNDVWLLRWLRARELNLDKAEEMFRNFMKWREEEKMDEIHNWKAPEFMETEFPFQVTGFDYDGCVVATVRIGTWNIKKAMGMGMKKDFVRYAAQILEQTMNFLEYVSTEERFVYQFVAVADLEGFSIRQVMSKEKALKCGWAVNAPKLFEVLYNIIKPLLTARTLAKVKIHGSNVDSWRSALLQMVPPDQLPSSLGGSKTTCKNYKLHYGYEIFPWYDTLRESELITISLAAGKKHLAEYQLAKGHSISWNFRSEEYDIGFALEFRSDESKSVETLFECAKVDSHLHLQRGAILIEKPGTYTVVLDNSASRFRAKTVFYGVRILPDAWTCFCSKNVITPNHAP